jgi:hypothetical protein
MKGYFKVNLTAEDSALPRSSSKRTGEQRLALIEKTLRKDGVEFVEDFDGDCVIVRYGEYVNDAIWDAYRARVLASANIEEPAEVCA